MSDIDEFGNIGDLLIDQPAVEQTRRRHMNELIESYKKANVLLGYFSCLDDYVAEFSQLNRKVFKCRHDIVSRYKDILAADMSDEFKQLLIPSTKTEWYAQGICKYQKVKNYTLYHYRRKLYVLLEDEALDLVELKKIVETVIALDKYYNIYDDIITFFMQTSNRFKQAMARHFSEFIYL